MKTRQIPQFLLLLCALWMSACGGKNQDNPQAMIAGNNSKIWKASKETNASGDREKLSKEEKNEVMQFYADGKFTINGASQSANGTWTHDATAKTLTLQYAGADVTETFQVENLSDDNMKLKAADGSELTLETE